MMKNLYKFTAEVWLYPGMAGWHFISIPKEIGKEIKEKLGKKSRSWGSLPVKVTLRKTSWKTSIFPDTKAGTYLLPIKSEVRKKEGVWSGDKVELLITIQP